jgi:hypothetical protein
MKPTLAIVWDTLNPCIYLPHSYVNVTISIPSVRTTACLVKRPDDPGQLTTRHSSAARYMFDGILDDDETFISRTHSVMIRIEGNTAETPHTTIQFPKFSSRSSTS